MRAVVEIVALAAAMHRPVVTRLGFEREDLRIDVRPEDAIEFEMEERLLDARASSTDLATKADRRSMARSRSLMLKAVL